MSTLMEQMQLFLQQQQSQFLASQEQMLTSLTSKSSIQSKCTAKDEEIEPLLKLVPKLIFDSESGHIFELWFASIEYLSRMKGT